MLAVDTSAWIEWLIDTPTGMAVGSELPPLDQWLVPTMVQLELAKWARREGTEKQFQNLLAFAQKCVVVPLDSRLALAAAEIASRHKLATADAAIYATARAHGAGLLTCDAHFADLPGVRFIRKVAS
ncbi:type II toxin-antitoxin system VapC family toxin [Aureimonas leprariae]|uniref:Ribonuclease VapC n=1 Tax=Plantimonas leprariae TaxID=2615207 RepID=A0A7V7PR98_9HYPH|nr:type II toxin-antitoxin system VapC family toxin [Aureimonas leprariae]KAB0681207.1 type II toxin-antitoxin system VapC family toxin [Aureimonas leprariae]